MKKPMQTYMCIMYLDKNLHTLVYIYIYKRIYTHVSTYTGWDKSNRKVNNIAQYELLLCND